MKTLLSLIAVLFVLLSIPPAGFAQSTAGISEQDLTAVQGWPEDVLFYCFAGLTVISALGIVFATNIVRMATWLFFAFGGVAVLFFLLQAYFLGVVQLIVYVGGILVLIVFGIMLTSSSPWVKFEIKKRELVLSGMICLGLFLALANVLYHNPWLGVPQIENQSMTNWGRVLLQDYLVPFEIASVLLLVVMIGAAYLAKQEKRN